MMTPATPPKSNAPRYHSAIILLHWSMAITIGMMLISGVIMVNIELEKQWQFQLYQWHKSSGVLLMLALVVRIALRIITSIPPLPVHFSKAEQIAAKLGHLGLYVAMVTMVLSGWAMVSSSLYGLPTVVFGWFEWPHLPWFQTNQTIERLSKDIHLIGAISLGLLLVAHVGAVIKHRIADRENLLTRMWWQPRFSLRTISPLSRLLLASLVIGLIFLVFILTVSSPLQPPAPTVSETGSTATPDIVTTAHNSHDFTVDTTRSRVTFSGAHMGNPFSGVFNEWEARFHFNPEALENSHIHAAFMMDSANTGNTMYDGTLLESDWFASDLYPQATFTSDTIIANRNGINQQDSYRVTGQLTLRDITKPISFDVQINDLSDTSIQFNAEFIIDRLTYRIGASSDPDAEWVSRDIVIQLDIQADRN